MTQVKERISPLTDSIINHALGLRYEAIPTEAVERAKLLFLDYLGVTLGGKVLGESGESVLRAARALAAGARGTCTVAGEADLFPPNFAALLNGAFAHALDFDDTHRETFLHQGAPLFSALIAAGEVAGASGRDFLTAAIAGYDIGARLGFAHGDGVHRRGFHPTATTGIFAVTAATARLMGDSAEVLEDALGVDLSFSVGCQQFLETGGWNKHVQVGMTAHNAFYALALARAGCRGVRKPLEGRFGYYATFSEPGADVRKALEPPDRFEVLRAGLKPYPCCRFNHSIIDGVSKIVRERGLRPDDIRRIQVYVPATQFEIVAAPEDVKRNPVQTVDGQFSVYFAAAIAVLEQGFTWDSYQRLQDPAVRALIQRTDAYAGVDIVGMAGRTVVETAQGAWTESIALPSGEPENFLTTDQVRAKFMSLASRVLRTQRAEQVAEKVAVLEKLDSISEVTELIRG